MKVISIPFLTGQITFEQAKKLYKCKPFLTYEIFTHDKVDKLDSIFQSTGDMAIPFCKRHDNLIRGSYCDNSCLYPEEGDIVVTYNDGYREII